MDTIRVFLEIGQQKIFAGAQDWPGWCRGARIAGGAHDEQLALQALLDYVPRYAQVLNAAGVAFQPPESIAELSICARLAGNSTTDFGVPSLPLDSDRDPLERDEFERLRAVLRACWAAFDLAYHQAVGKELTKGPRGGGRDVSAMYRHVLGGEQSYLARIGVKAAHDESQLLENEMLHTREEVETALEDGFHRRLPQQGPRGGAIWPLRYFIRRAAWHVLDHAWEIVDRSA